MKITGIHDVEDVRTFFHAFNNRHWDIVFQFLHPDCSWDAAEKKLKGKDELINYWTNYYAKFKETLGEPENIVMGRQIVYLQVTIHLDFIENGKFMGRSFRKGDTYDFRCTDFYKLDEDGMIISGQVYMKHPHIK